MKIIMIALVLILSACGQQLSPCMSSNEVGTIKTQPAPSDLRNSWAPYVFLVEVNGAIRVCQIESSTAVMLKPGMQVRLTNAYRQI